MALSDRLAKAGLTSEQSNALTAAVQNDPNATNGLVIALDGAPKMTLAALAGIAIGVLIDHWFTG